MSMEFTSNQTGVVAIEGNTLTLEIPERICDRMEATWGY